MKHGMLIAFEGPDFSGKTTQIDLLAEQIEDVDSFVREADPGSSIVGNIIREFLLDSRNSMTRYTECLLFAAASTELNNLIHKKRHHGIHVLLDRHTPSFWAYQHKGNDLDWGWICNAIKFYERQKASITFYLLPPFDELWARREAAGSLDRVEQRPKWFHQKIYSAYYAYAMKDPSAYTISNADLTDIEVRDIVRTKLNGTPFREVLR